MYFITVCTKDRENYFGIIENDEMILNTADQIAHEYWENISSHFQHVSLGEFKIMPNHMHGIIIIEKFVGDTDSPLTGTDLVWQQETGRALSLQKNDSPPPHPRFRNQGKHTISAMVGSYKSAVTKQLNLMDIPFGWQTRFHDHIIRNHESFVHISNYIINNARHWKKDKFYK